MIPYGVVLPIPADLVSAIPLAISFFIKLAIVVFVHSIDIRGGSSRVLVWMDASRCSRISRLSVCRVLG